MITLLGSLLGFLGAAFPEFLKMFRDRSDREHELAIMDKQIEIQKLGFAQKLEEIKTTADISETDAIYKTYYSGIRWVDAVNASVRPVLAYAFFLLYALVKMHQMNALPWQLWTDEDQAIFAGIITFYYGQRAMRRLKH